MKSTSGMQMLCTFCQLAHLAKRSATDQFTKRGLYQTWPLANYDAQITNTVYS